MCGLSVDSACSTSTWCALRPLQFVCAMCSELSCVLSCVCTMCCLLWCAFWEAGWLEFMISWSRWASQLFLATLDQVNLLLLFVHYFNLFEEK